jgi:uncharacterized protein
MKKILSIDGGGIRGIIPATVLAKLEERTERSVSDMFDLIAGTSTGGILALGLSVPADGMPKFGADRLVALYEERGATIFHRDLWHRFRALENLLEEKYPSGNIEKVLEEYFDGALISQALTEVLITSYDLERREPYFFKRHKAVSQLEPDWLMREVARATSAAPTYFEPAKLTSADKTITRALVDGGVYANNPAMCGYAEARSLWPDEEEVLVVSLGTGELTRPIPYEDAKEWGLAKWARPILGVVFDGVSDTVDYQLRQLCKPSHYYRFQDTLKDGGSDDLDDSSRGNIQLLKQLAENIIKKNDTRLRELARQLAA